MEAAKSKSAQESLKKDAICTRCHDESETTPILAIYQTKHGVRGDSRTPNCQTCHGESEKHLKGDPNVKGRAAPDVVFKKGAYAVSDDKARASQCLSCHKGTNRTNWDGSQHQNNQIACNDCHKVHAPVDKVRDRKMQTEVCFTCHKDQRADTHKISTHPIDAGKVVCSDCHNPHGSTGPKMLKKSDGDRDLLHLPCRETRPVPVGAPAGDRGLHQLPHAARFQHHAAAEIASSVPVPGMP